MKVEEYDRLENERHPWVYFKAVLFGVLFRYVTHLCLHSEPANQLPTAAQQRRVANLTTSILHSVVSGLWALALLVMHTEMFYNMMEWFDATGFYLMLLSLGYLMNDVTDLLIYEGLNSRVCELMSHHAVCIWALVSTIQERKFMAFVVLALLMEVNSIFLHYRTWLKLLGRDSTSIYKACSWLNVVTFVPFRLCVSVYMVVWVLLNHQNSGHILYSVTGIFGSFFLFFLNVTLFYRVLKADRFLSVQSGNGDGAKRQIEKDAT